MSEDEDFTALDSDDDMDESSTNFGFVKFCFPHSAHVLHLKEVEKWFMLASCVPMAAVL